MISNRIGDVCFMRQDRQIFNRKIKMDMLPRTPVCYGIFKKCAEIDLQELHRIQSKLTGQSKLDKIDMQTALSTFGEHTVFSIFAQSVKFHEQMLQQIQEGEFPEEEQEDES